MRYRNKFINQYLRIKICTNSKRLYRLIGNVLNLENNSSKLKPRIKIKFYLDEAGAKKPQGSKNFLYQIWPGKSKSLTSFFSTRIVDVTTNPKTGVVKGTILDYQESLKEPILDFILMQPLRFILAHHGLFFLHASVVCKDKNCILIIGPQDSGKSTLAFILSQNGFDLLSDDDCFVKLVRNQTQLFPFPTKVGLNEKILKKYPELNRHTLKNYHYGGKCRLSLNHIAKSNNYKGLRCKMIIFPRYKGSRNIYLKRLSNKEAVDRLINNSLIMLPKKLYPEISLRQFVTLHGLIKETDSFELTYNDAKLEKVTDIIERQI